MTRRASIHVRIGHILDCATKLAEAGGSQETLNLLEDVRREKSPPVTIAVELRGHALRLEDQRPALSAFIAALAEQCDAVAQGDYYD
jgi:hypothetical protein